MTILTSFCTFYENYVKYVEGEVQKKDAVDGEEKHSSTAAVWVLNEKVRRVSPLGCYYADFAVERERGGGGLPASRWPTLNVA